MKKQPGKRITIVFSIPDWKKLRRLQEQNKIESFQQATIEGIKLLIEKLEAEKSIPEEKKGEEEHEKI